MTIAQEEIDLGLAPESAPPPTSKIPQSKDRLLPILVNESRSSQYLWLAVAITFVACYAFGIFSYWAPADAGIDQNAYLVGGRLMGHNPTDKLELKNGFQYVGGMFVRTEQGAYYPKYPFGLPLIYGLIIRIFGEMKASIGVFLVSPISAIGAVLGMFFLARTVAGSFVSVLAAILLGTSQMMLMLANNPNSHASCLFCIVWGFFLLIRWWQTGSIWRGILGGFLLGFAALIRYSEALLVLPIAVACLSQLRWSSLKSYFRCAIPGLAWAVPVLALFIYNKATLGTPTGYDSTNESEFGAAFTWIKFTQTWEQVLRTLYDMGAFFILPLGVAGMVMLYRRSWQLATMLIAWVLPGVALYTSYYFSPDRGMAFARFFLTFIPGIVMAAAVCLQDGIVGNDPISKWKGIPLRLAAGTVVAISASVGVYRSINGMQDGQFNAMNSMPEDFRARQSLAVTGQILLKNVPEHSLLFAQSTGGVATPINYIQFLRNWDLYSTEAFSPGGGRRGMMRGGPGGPNGQNNTDQPSPMQPRQREYLASVYGNLSADDLEKKQIETITAAFQNNQRVFVVASPLLMEDFQQLSNSSKKFKLTTIAKWRDVDSIEETPPSGGRFTGRGGGRGGRAGGFGNRNFNGNGGPGNGGFNGPPGGGPGFGGPGGPGGFAGGPGGPGGGMMERLSVQPWQLVELVPLGNNG